MHHKAFLKYLATGEYVPTIDAGIADSDAIKGSLEAHDRRFHPNGYKEGDHCDFRARLAKGDFADASIEGLMAAAGESDTPLVKVNEEAENLVREYEGQDLEAIGEHLPDRSLYNHNFYRLPNGTIVLLQNDDYGFSQVFVVFEDGYKANVGAQEDNGTFMIGEFY